MKPFIIPINEGGLKNLVIILIASMLTVSGLLSCKRHKQAADAGTSSTEKHLHIGRGDKGKVADRLLEEAYAWLGTPYTYARAEKGVATDCSGMVLVLFRDIAGIELPRNSARQAEVCGEIDKKKVRKGDLVFFATGKDSDRISHVGIMIDNDRFIHASSAKGVVISTVSSSYYTRTLKKFGRILK